MTTLLVSLPLAAEKTQQSGFNTYAIWILLIVMMAVFYFFLLRPQRKRAQEHDQMISKLKKGDEVVTIGGIRGVVRKITEDAVVLEVDKGVRISFTKSAIAKSLTPPEDEEETAAEDGEETADETSGEGAELEDGSDE